MNIYALKPAYLNVFDTLAHNLHKTFIVDDRYKFFIEGFWNTIYLSLIASVVGIALGLLLAFVNLSRIKPLKFLAKFYIDIIRGTPVVTQLLIFYFVICAKSNMNAVLIGGLAFGFNSAAYVAEIARAGILSIDGGQMEAGRSLGLTYWQTMFLIIMPQAVKNIIPALANEFIVLIKETAIAGYITVMDLNKAASAVKSRTYDFATPLLSVAVIYYIIIKVLTILFGLVEKNMRKSDYR